MATLPVAAELQAIKRNAARNPARDPDRNAQNLTKYVADFVDSAKYEDIPDDVIELGKKSILDGIGLALSGSVANTGNLIRRYIQGLGCTTGDATIIGTSDSSASPFAALVNGIAIHNDDFDDTYLSPANGVGVHPTVTVLPAALALAESGRRSGKDLLTAYHLGAEVESKIADAIVLRNSEDPFHPTGTCGVFGSAAACGKIRGLDRDQLACAIGIAAGQASGLRENFGTMTKSFTAGHAAESGLVAVTLAALGWTASKQILEAPLGFFRTENETFDSNRIQGRLGKPWTFSSPGISLKRFPSGALTHPAMDTLLGIIAQNHIHSADVKAVNVDASSNVFNTLLHHHPSTGLQGKFSMEFCLGILLLQGQAGIGQFTDEVVQRPDVQAMIARIHFRSDHRLGRSESDRLMTTIELRLRNGQIITAQNAVAKGSPGNPLTIEEVADKFQSCAQYAKWPKGKSDAIVQQVRSLEDLKDVSRLAKLLTV